MSELSIHELETQHGELLPEREALGAVIGNAFNITLAQVAEAVQAITALATNTALNIAAVFAG